MNLSDIQYTITSTSSLSVGSVFSKEDLEFYTDGITSIDFPFGKSNKDVVSFGVYGLDGTPIISDIIRASGSYQSFTQSYFDVNNSNIVYSYNTFTSDWVLVGNPTQSLLLDISSELRKLNVSDGNYTITIDMLRNLVGSETGSADKLIIDTISTNRDEVYLIPKALAGTNSTIVDEFNLFANGQFRIKEVARDLLNAIGSPQIYTAYYAASTLNPSGSSALKSGYGFNSYGTGSVADIEVVNFLTDIYYGVQAGGTRSNGQIAVNRILGIYDQFQNWMFQNYDQGATFQNIKDYYYSLFKFIVDTELGRITNAKPANYDSVINFLQTIFYNTIFYPQEQNIETNYDTNLFGYFKNYVNFDAGLSYSILNRKTVPSDDLRFHNKMALKLDTPLPQTISVGDEVWITNNFGAPLVVQNIIYSSQSVSQVTPLRGPNFLIKIQNEGNATEELSLEQVIGQTGSLYTQLVSMVGFKSSGSMDYTNYRYFNNFVNFSSATMRIAAFTYKLSQIKALTAEAEQVSVQLTQNPNDQYYLTEISDAQKQITQIEGSMDGYEAFLYNNYEWYAPHSASASYYDEMNDGSLINGLPQFILDAANDNADYITFVGMIGHFFDNLSLAIKQYTEKNKYASSPNRGISMGIISDMLASLGWDVEISKDNLSLLLASFSKRNFDPSSELYGQVERRFMKKNGTR